MRISIRFALIVLWSSFLWGTDKIQPLDVKVGLWEVTHDSQVSGLPPIPPEALARMTPEQRAKFEERMKARASQGSKTTTRRHCVTKEELNKENTFGEDQKSCTKTVMTSSSRKLELRMECMRETTKTNGTFRVEAIDSENVKGSTQMVVTGGDRTMNINSTFTAKWIGPDCGDTK